MEETIAPSPMSEGRASPTLRTPPTVAVLDDDASMRRALSRLLRLNGYAVELFESGTGLLKAAQSQHLDCLLLDLEMPQMTGFEVLKALQSRRNKVPVIVITGSNEPAYPKRARNLGAAGYLLKPVRESTLIDAIECARANGSGSPSQHP